MQAHYSTDTHTINPAGATLSVSVSTFSSSSEKKHCRILPRRDRLALCFRQMSPRKNTEKEGLAVSGTHRSTSRACDSLNIQGEGASGNKSRLANNCGALVQNATLSPISCYMLAHIRQPRFPEGAKKV